jgi:hypothetical protein
MVFNAIFNNISVISCRSVLLVDEIGVPGETHRYQSLNLNTILTKHNLTMSANLLKQI